MLPPFYEKGEAFIRELLKISKVLKKEEFWELWNKFETVPVSEAERRKEEIIGKAYMLWQSPERIQKIIGDTTKKVSLIKKTEEEGESEADLSKLLN